MPKITKRRLCRKSCGLFFSGYGVFLQTLNFPVKFQRKDRDRGRQIREGCEKCEILQPIRRCSGSLSQKRCKIGPKLLVTKLHFRCPSTADAWPTTRPHPTSWYITSYNHFCRCPTIFLSRWMTENMPLLLLELWSSLQRLCVKMTT